MSNRTVSEDIEKSNLRVLLLFQGGEATRYCHHLYNFLPKFTNPRITVCTLAATNGTVDQDLFAKLNGLVDNCDAAIAILTLDQRMASAVGDIWFEIGFWLARKGPETIMFACHESVESTPAYFSGYIIPRFDAAVELEAYVSRFINQLQEKSLTGAKETTDQKPRIIKSRRRTVFISYSHADRPWLERVLLHLKPLERKGIIDIWTDTRLTPGSRWKDDIQAALSTARAAVLLVSASFLASDFIIDNEVPTLLANAKSEGASVIPFIIKPSRFALETNLSQFQSLNDPSRPLLGLSEYEQEVELVRLSAAVESALGKPD